MLRKHLLRAGLAVFLSATSLCLPMLAPSAEEPQLPVLTTQTRIIAIFKNGLGFFMKEGEVALEDEWAVTQYVPSSALGSLWIGSPDEGVSVEEAVAFEQEIEKETQAISMQELLKANEGKKVTLVCGGKTVEGTVKLVAEDRLAGAADGAGYDYDRSYSSPSPQPQSATLVIVETEEGVVALNKGNVSRIDFPGTISMTLTTREKAKRIKFRLATEQRSARLSLSYLQKGITWIPSYLIDISDPGKTRITMKATVINDVEHLENVDVFFVVGYPNFAYADILSPMALEQSITQFIATLGAAGTQSEEYGRLANVMRQSASYAEARSEAIPPLDYGYAAITGLPGASEEDLFLYHKTGVSLDRGQRAYYHVFSEEVEYEHVYEWKIPDTLMVDPSGYYRSDQDRTEKEHVWHSVKMANSSAYPWTTAPAFVVSGWKPLAQDVLDYTPRGASTNLRLTVATDITIDRRENEVDRERQVTLYRRSYDLVTVRGELHIENHKSKDVVMEISKRLTGDVSEVSHGGRVQKTAEGLRGVNQSSVISWRVPIGAGEETDLVYEYTVFISN